MIKKNSELNDPTCVLIQTKGAGYGSGFFVGKDLIVTNIHVIAGAISVSATLVDCKNKKFIVEGVSDFDAKNDLVVLKVVGEGSPFPVSEGSLPQGGDTINVVGYPGKEYKVTEGHIHGIWNNGKWLRMKIKTAKGNSGGPVLNCMGRVIGVHTRGGDLYSYAVHSNVLKKLLAPKPVESLKQWNERKISVAYACYLRGEEQYGAGHYRKAIIWLDKAICLCPGNTVFHNYRGKTRRLLGQSTVGDIAEAQKHYKDAIADYTKTLQIDSKSVEAYDNLGIVKCFLGQSEVNKKNTVEARQYYTDAIKDYTRAIRLCLNYAPAYGNRGFVWARFGRLNKDIGCIVEAQQYYQHAVNDYTKAIELYSNCPSTYICRAYICRAEARCVIGELKSNAGSVDAARDLYQGAICDCDTAANETLNLANETTLKFIRSKAENALSDLS